MHSTRPTQAVTTARRSQREDRRSRMRTYLIAMGFRTAAFPLAVWALLSGWTVAGWVLAVAAVGLPPIAVTLANAVDHRRGTDQPVSPTRALPAAIRREDRAPDLDPDPARDRTPWS